MRTARLLNSGYFPKELPPPFTTSVFAAFVEENPGWKITPRKNTQALVASANKHNLSRSGSLRRVLRIPNPINHLELCRLLSGNWSRIEAQFEKADISLSTPIPDPAEHRALITSIDGNRLPIERARNRATARFIVRTDIARFYDSIYTHSIPWAVDGKKSAKRNRKTGFANRLDRSIRNSQDQQTLGIPTGPDTSLVIAELLLAAVDEDLMDRGLQGFRFMDDFEFAFRNRSEAEEGLAQIEEVLGQFELAINPNKTHIDELPVALERHWTTPIREFHFEDSDTLTRSEILLYFNRAFESAKKSPYASILPYAIARIRKKRVAEQDWDFLSNLLMQCVMIDGSSLQSLLPILDRHRDLGMPHNLEEVLNYIVIRRAPLGHGSEVAWAVWTAICFGQQFGDDAASGLSRMDDSVVALLALHARSSGSIRKSLDTDLWESFCNAEGLFGNHWLIAYEGFAQGWLAKRKQFVRRTPNFEALHEVGVKFYDSEVNAPAAVADDRYSGSDGEPID